MLGIFDGGEDMQVRLEATDGMDADRCSLLSSGQNADDDPGEMLGRRQEEPALRVRVVTSTRELGGK